jgi:general secretion pathway protein D
LGVKFFRQLGVVGFLAASMLVLPATSGQALVQEDAAASYSFAFRDAAAAQVIDEVVGRALGLSYTVDPAVNALVTFRLDQELTPSELLEAFQSTLATYGIVVLRNGESLLFTTRANARTSALRGSGTVGGGGYVTETLNLVNAMPSQIAESLAAMGAPDLVVFSDDETGVLIVGGSPGEIAAARETIASLDRRIAPESRWFDLTNVSADVVARELTQIAAGMNMRDVQIAPIPRLRGLMVFGGTQGDLDQVAELIARLDNSSPEGDGTLWYYRPVNVAAESLAITLNDVLGNGTILSGTSLSTSAPTGGFTDATPGGAPAFGAPGRGGAPSQPSLTASGGATASGGSSDGDTRVAVDRESNTLVISSPQDRRLELLRLLQQLDVRPRQVLIEASVLEVTLTDEFRFGVDWSVLSSNERTVVTSTGEQSGGIAATFPGIAITYIGPDATAAIDALRARTNVEVVSSPKIIVLDNRSAQLQIGDQVPVVTQTSQSNVTPDAPRVVNIEYRDTGVQLYVTPRVTGENDITLIITQEVSSVSRTTTSGIDSPTIQQRRFDSSLLLNSGGTVALGGLIASNATSGNSGAPGLGDIPILGHLFRQDFGDGRRTELIVLLSATILSDPEASSLATQGLITDMKGLEERGLAEP